MSHPTGNLPGGPPTLQDDWVTIWQSEVAALAADRELQEAMQRWADDCAAQARVLLPRLLLPRPLLHESAPQPPETTVDPPRPPGPDAPPRPPPSRHDPGGSDALLTQLLARLEHIERRLAELERR